MNISPEEARTALDGVQVETAKTQHSMYVWFYYTLLWGIVWTIGFLATQLQPQLLGWIWAAMLVAGMSGSSGIGAFSGSRFRMTPGTEAARVAIQLGSFYGILYAFAALWLIVLRLNALQIGFFWITVVMFGTIIAGVWLRDARQIILGVSVTLLTLLGYYLWPHYFWGWAALVAGCPLIGISLYSLKRH